MRKLFEFIRSIHVVVLLVVMELVAINYYADSSPYPQARLLSRSNEVVGGMRSLFAGVRRYFHLSSVNRALTAHVAELEEELALYREAETKERLTSYLEGITESKYRFATARVISNSINRSHNLITLNRGRQDGVEINMSVLTPDASVVGYVVECTENYAVAVSILNTSFRGSAKIIDTDYFGSVSWDGKNSGEVVLSELSKYAEPKVGQEIVTTGFSDYFPEDQLIGWIESVEMNETKTYYTARVRLAADISALGDVILVANRDSDLMQKLMEGEGVKRFNH